MKRLKCPDCGGQVRLQTSGEGHTLGTCAHCAAEFVVAVSGRQHIIVEHRFPDGARPAAAVPGAPPLLRRAVLGFGAAALAGLGVAAFSSSRRSGGPAEGARPGATVIFNTGGEGPAPGQFRDQAFHVGVDSLGRAALMDNRDRVSVFGPEGQFLTQYVPDQKIGRRFCALLPGGDLLLAGSEGFHRLALETGALRETVRTKTSPSGWNAAFALTAQSGILAYSTADHGLRSDPQTPVADEIRVYGPDLREQRRMTGFLSQAIAPDPMVARWPRVTDIACDAAGSLWLNIRAEEDNDLRGGVFEFNAEGRLLRRVEVEQAWQGRLAVAPDQSVWYSDAWRSDLQRISPGPRQSLKLSGLGATRETAPGNVAAFAFYPDGDIAVTTMNHRFLRLRPERVPG